MHTKQLTAATPDLALFVRQGDIYWLCYVILLSISCKAEHISNNSESKAKITNLYVHNFTCAYSTLCSAYSVNLDCPLLDLKSSPT